MKGSLIGPLLESPFLVEHIAELNRVMAAERQRRLKFYEEITEDGTWEFINGQVVLHSPAQNRHNRVVARLGRLLSVWVDHRQLGQVTMEKTLCQFPRNDYEPDVVFFGLEKAHRIRPEDMLHPIPDLIVEVLSPSTEKNDRGVKFEDYEAHGVGEYWIVDPNSQTVEVFVLEAGRYPRKVRRSKTGTVSSTVVTGFAIPIRALFDDSANLAALRGVLA